MNILFASDVSIAKVIGGAERVLYEQSTRLQDRGHCVHILTRRTTAHQEAMGIVRGVHEWRYAVDETSPRTFIRSTRAHARRMLSAIGGGRSFDIINFHQPFTAYAVLSSPVIRATRKVYTVHSLSFEEFLSRNPAPDGLIDKVRHRLNVGARRWIEKKVLDESDRIVVLSRFTRRKLETHHRIPSEKISILPGGVDLERFHPAVHKNDIRRKLSLPEDKFILLTVRNLVSRMGIENFMHALRGVAGALQGIHVVIGGDGPLKERLISLSRDLGIEEVCTFAGFIPDGDLPDYYRAADLFILPTLELEGFGLVTLEALASGLPVLGTPVGGTLEILRGLDERYIFDNTSPEAMTKRMIEFGRQYVNNPGLLREASSRCRSFVEENYSWEKNVDLLENLFRITCGC